MARQKGDKDYTERERQLLISLINDYSLFGAQDQEMIEMLSEKIGKKISETLFYRLKKEAIAKRGETGEWLDYYTRFHFVEHYRKRIEEMEHIQKHLLMIFTKEAEKQEDGKKNKYLMNQLAKTIAGNSKVLAEFGMAPPILSKIKSMILSNIDNNGEILHYDEERTTTNIDGNNSPIPNYNQNTKSAIFSPLIGNNNMNDISLIDDSRNNSKALTGCNDSQRVF